MSEKYYLYRFLNNTGEVIYVGKTERELRQRMKEHFGNHGHLKEEVYSEVKYVEYLEFNSKSTMDYLEIYFINLYNCKYNTQNKSDNPEIHPVINQEWKSLNVMKERELHDKVIQMYAEKSKECEKLKRTVRKLEKELKDYKEHGKVINERGAGRKERFTEEQKRLIVSLYNNGNTQKKLSEIFNCGVGTINKVLTMNRGGSVNGKVKG